MPQLSGLRAPKFITLVQRELTTLLHTDRHPLTVQVYLLLLTISDFHTGEILTSYAYLEEMTTPPMREKGGRRGAPSMQQLRRVIDKLIGYGLVKRNAERNAAQGQLRLYVRPLEAPKKK